MNQRKVVVMLGPQDQRRTDNPWVDGGKLVQRSIGGPCPNLATRSRLFIARTSVAVASMVEPDIFDQLPKSCISWLAARTPEIAQKLTHCPGCVALPVKYRPRIQRLRCASRPARMNRAVITGFMLLRCR